MIKFELPKCKKNKCTGIKNHVGVVGAWYFNYGRGD